MASDHRSPSDIHPCLSYEDAGAAIDWLCEAFGFTRQLVIPGPDGSVIHSELSLGTGVVMIGSPRPDRDSTSPSRLGGRTCTLSICIDDPDAHHARAVAAGAEIIQPLRDEDHGVRGYMAADPEGHHWYFCTYRPGAHWANPPD